MEGRSEGWVCGVGDKEGDLRCEVFFVASIWNEWEEVCVVEVSPLSSSIPIPFPGKWVLAMYFH